MSDPPSTGDDPPASLSSVFHRERESTEEAFARTASLAGTGSWERALAAFALLETRLRRRIRRAEEYVFPLFEIKAGSASELTRTLVREHRDIEDRLRRLDACLRERRLDDIPSCVRRLQQILQEHDGRVGRLVYPLLDCLLTVNERRVLLAGANDDGEPGPPDG